MPESKSRKNKPTTNSNLLSTTKGVLEITRSGLGYVVVPDNKGDIIVRPGDFNTALNGDTVRVKVTKENFSSGRKEGKITDVVTRKQLEFIGYIQLSATYAFFISFLPFQQSCNDFLLVCSTIQFV